MEEKTLRRRFVIIISLAFIRWAASAEPFHIQVKVFDKNDNNPYTVFKVPSIVITSNNTILIAADARGSSYGDWDPSDGVIRRSTDGGITWSPLQVVVFGRSSGRSFSDFRLIAEGDTVHMIYGLDYSQIYHVLSTDAGETWDSPTEITDIFNTYKSQWDWVVLCPGAGHGIQTDNGRLLFPGWIAKQHYHGEQRVVIIYSDDHGSTWKPGGLVDAPSGADSINEAHIVQLSTGHFMLNARTHSMTQRLRSISYSENGVDGWTRAQYDSDLTDPQCAGALVRYDDTRLLFSNCAAKYGRFNLTIRVSDDDGSTWGASKGIWWQAGYSDLAVDDEGFIYILHEDWTAGEGMFSPNRMVMQKINLDYITDGSSVSQSVESSGQYTLYQNHSNPFNEFTTIHFNIHASGHVRIEILNTLGHVVEVLVDAYRPAGRHEIRWNGVEFPSGVYFCRMKVDCIIRTRRMLLLK